ncbi:uncharacterized protein LOC134212992 [Armigeres subalbatus]|uniref:uncharacterized protein LOC134212992 n=1 Tax=Armigeres subalbatus TaxID=124917 RepID=UPI002ED37454
MENTQITANVMSTEDSVIPGKILQYEQAVRSITGTKLPEFSGNPEEWNYFRVCFEKSTAAWGFTNEDNLIRLKDSIKEPALDLVQGLLTHPNLVPKAMTYPAMLILRFSKIFTRFQQMSLTNFSRSGSVPSNYYTLLGLVITFRNIYGTIHCKLLGNRMNVEE